MQFATHPKITQSHWLVFPGLRSVPGVTFGAQTNLCRRRFVYHDCAKRTNHTISLHLVKQQNELELPEQNQLRCSICVYRFRLLPES